MTENASSRKKDKAHCLQVAMLDEDIDSAKLYYELRNVLES